MANYYAFLHYMIMAGPTAIMLACYLRLALDHCGTVAVSYYTVDSSRRTQFYGLSLSYLDAGLF